MLKMNQQNGVFSKKRIVFTTLLIATTAAVYAQTVDDDVLATQSAGDQKVSPEMINLVKHDAHIPLEQQLDKHQHLAKEQADQINKENLESTAASDYEIKKKTDNSKLLADERKVYIPGKSSGVSEITIRESSMCFNSTGNVQGSGTATVKLNNY